MIDALELNQLNEDAPKLKPKQSSGPSTVTIVAIAAGVAIAALVVATVIVLRRRQQDRDTQHVQLATELEDKEGML